jgi:hypothetical protein
LYESKISVQLRDFIKVLQRRIFVFHSVHFDRRDVIEVDRNIVFVNVAFRDYQAFVGSTLTRYFVVGLLNDSISRLKNERLE